MRRRLFDGPDQGLGEPLDFLEGVRAPDRGRGSFSLVAALQSALGGAGCDVSYGDLMGRTGVAFMLFMAPEFPASLVPGESVTHAVAALRELGSDAQLREEPPPEETRAAVAAEVGAGRPALALDWGSHPTEWSVLVGVRGAELLGYACGGSRLENRPPRVARLLLLGDRSTSSTCTPSSSARRATRSCSSAWRTRCSTAPLRCSTLRASPSSRRRKSTPCSRRRPGGPLVRGVVAARTTDRVTTTLAGRPSP